MKTELALQEFLASRIAANLSPATIEWYKDRLISFAKSCCDLPRRPELIEQFLATVQGSPETRWDCYRALKTFFRFMSSRHRIPNPMDAIKPPRRPKTLMATLESNEMMRLLHSAQDPRDRAILTLIMDNGVRAGEVCSLLKHNIKEETVVVYGKTGWREVPISDETRRLLLQIAATSPDDHVFHGHKGPITRHLIYAIVRRHMEQAGIKGPKLGPHRIRHAFGKNYLVEGGDLIQAGANITFSPIGTVDPLVQSYILRLACTNGATDNTIVREFHYGQGGEGDDIWQWFRRSARDAYNSLDRIVERYKEMTGERIRPEDRAMLLEAMLRDARIIGGDAEAVRAMALERPPQTTYEMMNLMTYASSHIIERAPQIRRAQNTAANFAHTHEHSRLCPVCHTSRN